MARDPQQQEPTVGSTTGSPAVPTTDSAAVAANPSVDDGARLRGGPVSPPPVVPGDGDTLVRTRAGYQFHGTTVDVPITSTGVRVTRTQADEIVAEAEKHGEVVYIDETPEG